MLAISESSRTAPGASSVSASGSGGVRAGQRRALRRAARLQGGADEVTVRTLDVGAGGLAIVAPCNVAADAKCFVRFELPLRDQGVASLGLICSVVHCIYSHRESGFVVGLQFHALSEVARDLLERYLGL